MAHIRLTFQKPEETEVREILGDDDSISPDKSLWHKVEKDEFRGISVPPASRFRRGSGLSVSLQGNSSALQLRKFSFPTALPSSFLSLEPPGMGISARRRFSNVSDAVTRKLSNTIGWKSGQLQCQEIVMVGRSLCSQYIRNRLKRAGHLTKKCGLQRLRSAVSLPGSLVFREVYPELLGLGRELERLHPKLYINVIRQASSAPGGKITSDKEAGTILTAVFRELLKNELTWGKVVSLYVISGGLAVDCVRQGHYNYLTAIVEAMEEILEDELAPWIQCRGGWCALTALVKPPSSKWPSAKVLIFSLSFFTITLLIVFTLSLFGISVFL